MYHPQVGSSCRAMVWQSMRREVMPVLAQPGFFLTCIFLVSAISA